MDDAKFQWSIEDLNMQRLVVEWCSALWDVHVFVVADVQSS